MTIFEQMVSTQMLMFLYMLTGVIAARTGILKKEGRSSVIGLLMNIFLPCMVLDSFQTDVGAQQLLNAAVILAIAAVCTAATILLGKWLWRKKPESRRPVLEYTTGFSNLTAGLPIMELVYGTEGVFYASFFLMPIRILIWTAGIGLFAKRQGKTQWKTLLLNPCLLAMTIGLFFLFTPYTLPGALGTAVSKLGSLTSPLTILLIGASLSDLSPREVIDREVLQVSAIRLILLPLLTMAVLRLLGVNALIWQVSVILMAMPAATNGAIFAERYGFDHVFGAKCVFLSTVLSLVTVPLLALLF